MKLTDLPKELRAAAKLARSCESPEDFSARLAAGEAIRNGEHVRVRGLAFSGFVCGEGLLCGRIPAWKVRRPGGVDCIAKADAVHSHGLADPAAFFSWVAGKNS